jgi:hypothetical protein
MQNTDAPDKLPLPWANGGDRSVIPVTSQIGVTPGAASLVDGFPPLTRTPKATGGVPPNGLEMNGILFALSAQDRWEQAGGEAKFDSTFAVAIGGYPLHAVVQSLDGLSYWRSTVNANLSNPDTGGANWLPHFGYGSVQLLLSNVNVTLQAFDYRMPQIVLSGILTADVQLIFPPTLQRWLVVNNTTSGFHVTAKTAAGAGVLLGGGANQIYGDGVNIRSAIAFDGPNQSLASNGFQRLPGGLILQWGTVAVPSGSSEVTGTITFALPFPTGCVHISGNGDLPSTAGAWAPFIVMFSVLSKTGATFIADTAAPANAFAAGRSIRWFAIGY